MLTANEARQKVNDNLNIETDKEVCINKLNETINKAIDNNKYETSISIPFELASHIVHKLESNGYIVDSIYRSYDIGVNKQYAIIKFNFKTKL